MQRNNAQNFLGQGFDKCEIATLSQLQNWIVNSPYRAVNLYIGGSCRSCANSALTAAYISQLRQQGWSFIPTWVGPQTSCYACSSQISNNTDTAYQQGVNEANAAMQAASNLGLPGTIIYYDMEKTGDATCRNAAKSFISGWTAQLRAKGYQAGIYGASCNATISDFAGIANVPDAIWPANWYWNTGIGYYKSDANVWGVGCLADSLWANHQRIRQYAGEINEAWGGVTLNIDCDVIDGLVEGGGNCFSGDISGHWITANSPYTLCGDVTVQKGASLLIDPGVAINYNGHSFTVLGTLTWGTP